MSDRPPSWRHRAEMWDFLGRWGITVVVAVVGITPAICDRYQVDNDILLSLTFGRSPDP